MHKLLIEGEVEDGEFCSGRGDCSCGVCVCDPDWSGEDCSCSLKTENCLSPYTNTLCSKNSIYTDGKRREWETVGGTCECNECMCSKVFHG